ncbi:hypothetical protein OAH83_01285 [Methylophilaceae bacterium]|jgi:hypothetical protein|nr:hypothetical protein [Methylophilaceae bacterium]
MIIWTGWGILSVVIGITPVLLLDPDISTSKEMGLAYILVGIANWYLGKYFNDKEKEQILLDEKTGKRVKLKKEHTIFFMKMEYFSVFYLIGGVGALVA